MLVLTRKLQEKIRIGDQITITVLRTKGKAVRLGIEAPASVPVIRGELTFDLDDPTEATPSTTAASDANGLVTVDCKRREAETAGDPPRWPTEKPQRTPNSQHAVATLPPGVPPSEVHFERVSRHKLASLLPQSAAASAGPLRAMLDRRSAVT
jgi:carbon storage regulator CsrA